MLAYAEERPLRRPDLAVILNLVAGHFCCDVEQLRLPGQDKKLYQLHAFAALAVLKCSNSNLTELGCSLSRDVSSLDFAVRYLREKSRTNVELNRCDGFFTGSIRQCCNFASWKEAGGAETEIIPGDEAGM